ncbi:MAG TPA: hypothetical protein VFQ68_16350 [Streptosporangiaceae bacterium]|nr:hypothetical protein [Streptosporangiaceae bacterium]
MPIQVHLKSGTVVDAMAFDPRSTADSSVLVGMDDSIIVIVKSEIAMIAMGKSVAPAYFEE